MIFSAIKEKRPVSITTLNRKQRPFRVRCQPVGLEYSLKDDKLRVLAAGCKYKYINLARITECEFLKGEWQWYRRVETERIKELVLRITDERNALERTMLHFAHFEKQAERIDDSHYLLRLKYYANDETELVIRVLSFGRLVKVVEPEDFVELIKQRLILQKSCELK